ncbi:hypothetical protein Vadar_031290 [Vaccinium darrowii]|uniref:Uncharacterized protein n=1 Tax=Vaccinium darrowii TaxID=229202 RepID=A0ACB7X5I6_9ERIC|nr:hypothetical protein Vadar_031290 [Vaccinium darrowii]
MHFTSILMASSLHFTALFWHLLNLMLGTVFAYGQPISGRTHSVPGSISEPGVIARAMHNLFEIIQKRGTFVADLSKEIGASPDQVLQFTKFGESHRHIGERNMNLYSSTTQKSFCMIIECRIISEDEDAGSYCDAVHESILIQTLQTEKAELGGDLVIQNVKLSSALSQCNAKDELVEIHAKMAEEALAGWEKAESEVMSLKEELDDVKCQRVAGEERLTPLDRTQKECMQQLRLVHEEHVQRFHDAVMKTSKELKKSWIVLEEKLDLINIRLSKLGAENTQLSKALLVEEKFIQDMNKQRTRVEVDFKALMTRLESIEKEIASLKYKVRVLEKELEIRSNAREFNYRMADVAHKEHLESAKTIAKLKSKCRRLPVLVCMRLPGPATLAKLNYGIEMLGMDQVETKRRKPNPSPTGSFGFAMAIFLVHPIKVSTIWLRNYVPWKKKIGVLLAQRLV